MDWFSLVSFIGGAAIGWLGSRHYYIKSSAESDQQFEEMHNKAGQQFKKIHEMMERIDKRLQIHRNDVSAPAIAPSDMPDFEDPDISIPETMLRHLSKQVEQAGRKHIEALSTASTEAERDDADHEAKRAMCEVLSSIKRYNKGELPGYFYDLWSSYGCTD